MFCFCCFDIRGNLMPFGCEGVCLCPYFLLISVGPKSTKKEGGHLKNVHSESIMSSLNGKLHQFRKLGVRLLDYVPAYYQDTMQPPASGSCPGETAMTMCEDPCVIISV